MTSASATSPVTPNSPVPVAAVPVLPIPDGVVLPGAVVTIAVESPAAKAAADAAMRSGSANGRGAHLALVPEIEGTLLTVGVLGVVETAGELPDGRRAMVIRATSRVRVNIQSLDGSGTGDPEPANDNQTGVDTPRALWAIATSLDATAAISESSAVAGLATEYRALVEELIERRGGRPGTVSALLPPTDDVSSLADTVAELPDLTLGRRVTLLETIDPVDRLRLAISYVREVLVEAALKDKIRDEVNSGIEQQQREFLLRRQLDAIRKELGEGDGTVASEYRTRIATLGDALPIAVAEAVDREVERLERLGEQHPEHGWIRSWLDTLLDIPWGKVSADQLDVDQARSQLDRDTTGLDDAKDRVAEWLAARSLRARRAQAPEAGSPSTSDQPPRRGDGAILALVGPPGVGKTSLGESVANALGRRFVRIALGGVRDEAEIRGHRRTYVGARAGRIVQALREAGTMNPVVLLDEVDKLATGWSGDPGAALLEVLDPAQNHTFRDHYLDLDLDLSQVVFIATANQLDSIPGPLLDRLELITVDGYTDAEKVAIARNHLLQRTWAANGLTEADATVSDSALLNIIEGYTREAGVRGLERQLAKLARKLAVGASRGATSADGTSAVSVVDSAADVVARLGRPKRYVEELTHRLAVPGIATGLAVTGTGGDVLFVEVTSMPASDGHGEVALTVTGQLGDVMKESASIALSYVRAHSAELGIDAETLQGRRLHAHFPAGAVPKDGPSAGIAMTTAMVSLLTGRAVQPTVAMTGEVTLQGQVLPIGGVKQKLLAAHRAGVRTVIIPSRNEADLDDVPEAIRSTLTIHVVAAIDEVLRIALAA